MRLLTTFLLVTATALPAFAQIAEPPAPATASASDSAAAPLEEIGYDPKVKRDPYGHPIGSKKPSRDTSANKPAMRSDTGSNMRSDRSILKSAPAKSPTVRKAAAQPTATTNTATSAEPSATSSSKPPTLRPTSHVVIRANPASGKDAVNIVPPATTGAPRR